MRDNPEAVTRNARGARGAERANRLAGSELRRRDCGTIHLLVIFTDAIIERVNLIRTTGLVRMRLSRSDFRGLSGRVFCQNFNSTRLWIREVPGFRSASRQPGSGRGAASAARQDKKIAGLGGFESRRIPPQRSLSLWQLVRPPGTKGCAHMPVVLDREEGGFGRFTVRRSMDPVWIARGRTASCRNRPRGSVNRQVGHLFRGR